MQLRPSKSCEGEHRQITVTSRDLSSLILRESLRVHSPRKLRALAKAIRTYRFVYPVLVDGAGMVISGVARVLACRLLGWTTIPTICIDDLDEATVRAFMIADNRIAELSTWNEDALARELKALSEIEISFDIEATGFSVGEIDMKIEALNLRVAGSPPDADADDELPPVGPAVSNVGDLWILRAHKLICGSALENATFERLLNGEIVDATFADPPYGGAIRDYLKEKRGRQHREFVQGSADKMSDEQLEDFLATACRLVARHSRDGAVSFWCIDWRHAAQMLAAGALSYEALLNICVWAKTNGGMGALYRSRHELVMVYRKGKEAHRNNVQLGRYGRNRTNVWEYPGANSFVRGSEEADLLAQHPTPKPVALVADAILDVTGRRDLVLDPFIGSGATLLGAERTGRRCRGIDLDPLYIDLTIRRWQRMTGEAAVLEATGETFDALAAKAEVGQ